MTIHYYDPVNGDDANDGLTELTPKKLWPTSGYVAGDTYVGLGGTSAQITDKCNITANDVTFSSYGDGRFKIDGETTQTRDLGRNIRVDADGFTLDNIEITAPALGGAGHAVQVVPGINRFTVKNNCVFTGPAIARDTNNSAINYQGSAPFDIGSFTVNGYNTGIALINVIPGEQSSIHDFTINLNGHINHAGEGAGIHIVGNSDWGYKLHIYSFAIKGWSENGIDLAGASRILVTNFVIESPSNDYKFPAGFFLGSTLNTSGGHVIHNGIIRDMDSGSGIHSRGGHTCQVGEVLLQRVKTGVYNGIPGSNNNRFVNITFDECQTGFINTDLNIGQILIKPIFINCSLETQVHSGELTIIQ